MEHLFKTEDLPTAAFICATRRLKFIRCEQVNGSGRIAFVFDDPEGVGEELHVQFESGAECPATLFYDAIRHLRRVMSRSMEHGYQR